MSYDLTEPQKDLISRLVEAVRKGELPEEFLVAWSKDGAHLLNYRPPDPPELTRGAVESLEEEGLIKTSQQKNSIRIVLKGKAFEAVDSNFDAPDTSYLTQLTPLADTTSLDSELAERLQALGVGGSDPKVWDAGVRSATVLLEQRIRAVTGISDRTRTGARLVNDVFGSSGALAHTFDSDSEKEAYRNLYAGVVGVFRNDYGHRFVDPSPEDGGALIVFINLLLKMTKDLEYTGSD